MVNINKTFLKYVPILSPCLVEGSFKIDKDLQSKRITYTARAALAIFVASFITLTLTNCTGLGICLLGSSVLLGLSIPFDRWLTFKESIRRAIKEFIDSKHPSDELGKFICNKSYLIQEIIKQKGHFNKPVGVSHAGLITYANSKVIFKLIVDSGLDIKRRHPDTKITILSEILSAVNDQNWISYLLDKIKQTGIKPSDFSKKEIANFFLNSKTFSIKKRLNDLGLSPSPYQICKAEFENCLATIHKIQRFQLDDIPSSEDPKQFLKKQCEKFLEKDPILNKLNMMAQIYNLDGYHYEYQRWVDFILNEKILYLGFCALKILLNMNSQNYTIHSESNPNICETVNSDQDRHKIDSLSKAHNTDIYWNSTVKVTRYSALENAMPIESLQAIDRRSGKIFMLSMLIQGSNIATTFNTLDKGTFLKQAKIFKKPKECWDVFKKFIKFVYKNEEAESQTKQALKKVKLPTVLENMILDYMGYEHGNTLTRHLHPQSL